MLLYIAFMRSFLFSLIVLLICYSTNGQILKTIDSLQNQLEIVTENNETRIDLLNQIGYSYWVVDSQKSVDFGKQALKLSEELSYDQGTAKAKRVIGVAYWALGKLKLALENLTESQETYLKLNDEEGYANSLMNTGMVYADLKDYNRALEIYDKSIEKYSKLNLKRRTATTFTKIGIILIEQDKLFDAREYLTNALNMHSEENFEYGMAEAHSKLGKLFIMQNEIEQAAYHINKAIVTSKSINDEDGLIGSLIQFGKLLRLKKDYKSAEIHFNLALKKASKKKLKKYILEAYNELRILNKESGNLKESLTYYDRFIDLKDSIYNIDKSKQIAALEFNNELNEKKKEVTLLKEKERSNTIMKWGLIAGIISLTIIGLLLIYNIRQRAQRNKEKAKRKHELLSSKEELAKTALENAHLKQQELQQQLDFKNKELTSYALNFVQKNELLERLGEKLVIAKKATPSDQGKHINELSRIIKQYVNIDKDWEDFKRFFEEVHIDFHKKLQEKHPDLSPNDMKICSLTRLNLNIKETASILGISPESAKTARYRLRKKLHLEHEDDLLGYFLQLEKA